MKSEAIGTSFRNAVRYLLGGFMALSIASCGGGGGSPGTTSAGGGVAGGGTVSTVAAVGEVSLIFSSPELKSAGASGSEVTVTALVKNAQNNAMGSIDVQFSADSGALTGIEAKTDKNGQAKALLTTSGDPANRKITVSVQAGGKSASGTVNVVGTTVTAAGPTSISSGSTGEFTISLRDSANAAVANAPVTFSSQKGNSIAVKTSGGGTPTAPWTNSQGQVVLVLTASQDGLDTLTISAKGATTTASVNVNAAKLTVKTLDASGNSVTEVNTSTSCSKILAHYEISGVPQAGTVNISSSRGGVYTNSTCTTPFTAGSVSIIAGDSQPTYVKSDTAGVATITASVVGGPSAQTNLEFVAALTSTATISLQASPAVLAVNTGNSQLQQSTLTAVVRDGTAHNNFVKNAVVEFSIVNDKSGGSLSNPATVTTASNGAAFVSYTAGTADSGADGVTVQAKIQGTTSEPATTTLTVSGKPLFITAGTGSKLAVPSDTTYRQDYTVFVTDASGNPVPDVAITASVIPVKYRKGRYGYDSETTITSTTGWIFTNPHYVCNNEDANLNGIIDANEDYNQNDSLEPRIPLSVTSSGKTDATGTTVVSILYPRDRGNWTDVKLTVKGSVTGTESTYTTAPYTLPILVEDFSNSSIAPPGSPSPYGVNDCHIAN